MATTDTELQQLVINVGTEAQILAAIQGGTITADMLSIATDGSTDVTTDNVTISTNSSDEIQAIGTKNKNTTSGAANVVYDWVGTYAEWVSQNISTTHPEWVCYITDDVVSNTSDISILRAHEVIEFQAPTSANNYTWYRKYADGWVEQGGYNVAINLSSSGAKNNINLPVTMADTNYTSLAILCSQYGGRNIGVVVTDSTTAILVIGGYASSSGTSAVNWEVKGMYA